MVQTLLPVTVKSFTAAKPAVQHSSETKGFDEVLKETTVQKGTTTDTKVSSDDNSFANKIEHPASDRVKPAEGSEAANSSKDPAQTANPQEKLAEIVAQMNMAAQQALNAAPQKEVSALTALLLQLGQQTTQNSEAVLTDLNGSAEGAAGQSRLNTNINAVALNSVLSGAEANMNANTDTKENSNSNNGSMKNNISFAALKSAGAGTGDTNQAAGSMVQNSAGKDMSGLADMMSKISIADPRKTAAAADTFVESRVVAAADSGTGDIKHARDAASLFSSGIQTTVVKAPEAVHETIPASRIAAVDEIISRAVSTGQKDLVIRINPPDLGTINIRLSMDNGVLKADVRVDSATVKDNFVTALPHIKAALESTGIKAGDFNVNVREEQYRDGRPPQQDARQQNKQNEEPKREFSNFFA